MEGVEVPFDKQLLDANAPRDVKVHPCVIKK
jgi:hypothetical protein